MFRRYHIHGVLKTHEWAWTAKEYLRTTAKYQYKYEASIRAAWEKCYEPTKAYLEAEEEILDPTPENNQLEMLDDLD